jgi:hypothetical protein
MRLIKVKSVKSLPREIARRLCEDNWHPEVLEIFGGKRPAIFASEPRRVANVERYIRSIVLRYRRAEPVCRMVWPPCHRRTADK